MSEEVLALARRDADRIPVGKEARGHSVAQTRINDLMIEHARAGRRVVRLKGGDPYLFGRGGEEALALAEAGVPFEVVPGVSSLAAVPAAAGIPVTHRGTADTVTIATAQAADGGEPDYDELVAAGGTLVLFMGLGRLSALADGLVAAGMAPDTPSAVVSRGTLPDQRTVTAPIAALAAAAEGLSGPALVVVGDVVSLRARIASSSGAAMPARARA